MYNLEKTLIQARHLAKKFSFLKKQLQLNHCCKKRLHYHQNKTRRQAVARIADRTAKNSSGHVT